jgi:hypothetical protein
MANIFDDPFAPADMTAADTIFQTAQPRTVVSPGLTSFDQSPLDDPFRDIYDYDEPVDVRQTLDQAFDEDTEEELRSIYSGFEPKEETSFSNLLSAPKDTGLGPTEFQKKNVNWSDGGRSPAEPVAYPASDADFLEVDYMFGKKEGASDKPVLAANVFGRQFTAEELRRDDEGRRLLDLMQKRRSGEYTSGGTLANLAKGFGDWSASDIPYYGWISDIGATAGEAVEISDTIRRLQDGEKVTPHQVLQFRRYMLQQELESQRTAAYQVGAVARQAIPFMAEMFAESVAVAAIAGAATGGLGAIPGAIAGAAIAPARLLWRLATKGATKAVAKVTDRAVARLAAKGFRYGGDDLALLAARGAEAYGYDTSKGAARALVKARNERFLSQAAANVAASGEAFASAAAERHAVRREATRLMADSLSRRAPEALSPRAAARMLYSADYRTGAETAINRGLEELALSKLGKNASDLARLSGRRRAAAVAEGWSKVTAAERESFAKSMLSKIGEGGAETGLYASVHAGMEATTGRAVGVKYARSVADHVMKQALDGFDLRYGARSLAGLQRFKNFVGEHVARGFLQSEHAYFKGGLPTIGHAGFSSFHLSSDALKEGLGRVFIEAPIQGALNVAVGPALFAPVYSVLSGRDAGDFVVKGQLGFQTNALLTGDRKNMDSAKAVAIGSLFVEYMSESAGRGLAPMVGGALASNPVARAVLGTKAKPVTGTTRSIVGGVKDVWDSFLTQPLTKKAGSLLSRATEAVYGFSKMPVDKFAGIATSYVTKLANRAARKAGVPAAAVTKAQVARVLASKTLDGLDDGVRRVLAAEGIRTSRDLQRRVVLDATKGDRVKALFSTIGLRLAKRGLTPDEIVRTFRQMGKGGILEEMGEERLGDFVRGLFHLDDTASDAQVSEHVKSMFSGFTDPEQLMVEFFGFAWPGVVRGLATRSQRWIATGALAEARERSARIRNVMDMSGSSGAYLSVSADERTAAAQRAKVERGRQMLADALGTEESNGEAVVAAAQSAFDDRGTLVERVKAAGGLQGPSRRQEDGTQAPGGVELADAEAAVAAIAGSKSVGETADEMAKLAQSYMRYATSQELDAALVRTGASEIFGADGVAAIRREWRRQDGHSFDESDPVEQKLAAYKGFMAEPAKAEGEAPATVADLARRVRLDVPVFSTDSGATAGQRGQFANDEAPLADEGTAEQLAEDIGELARSVSRASLAAGSAEDMGFGRKALSKIIGLVGAATTGDVSLAFQNPAAWQARDSGISPQLLLAAQGYWAESLAVGFRALRDNGFEPAVRDVVFSSTPADDAALAAELQQAIADGKIRGQTLDAIEEAGRAHYEKRVARLAETVLAGSGILMVSHGQSDEAVLRYVASKHRVKAGDSTAYALSDGTTVPDYADPRFAESWAREIDQARTELVDELVRLAADRDALRYNRDARLGSDTPFFALDVVRALRNGTKAEMLGAIMSLPAFRGMARVLNVSGLSEYERETLFTAMNCRDVDLSAVSAVDDSKDLDGRDEALVASAMGRDLSRYTDEENQAAMKDFVRRVRLVHRGGAVTFDDLSGEGLSARVVPEAGEGDGRTYRAVVYKGGETLLDQSYSDAGAARDAVLAYGTEDGSARRFAERPKSLVVSDLTTVTSTDSTSLVSVLFGHDRDAMRRQYLLRLGGRDAVRAGYLLNDREERTLPPYLRRAQDGRDWVFKGDDAAKNAAAAFREELARARYYERNHGNANLWAVGESKTFAERQALMEADRKVAESVGAYEGAGAKILEASGVHRTATASSQALGLGDAWTCHLNYTTFFSGDVAVVSPDFASEGHSEGLLRFGIRQALDNWRGRTDEDSSDRNLLLAYAYREFRRCGEEVARRYDATDADKAKRVREAMRKVLRDDAARIHTASIAAIASSSVFFSCDRGLMQEGNGFLDGPEMAAVADQFRSTAVFPLFVSAIDEALGGRGLFHRPGVQSVSGLAAWAAAFGRDGRALEAARRSTVFGDGQSARNPFLVRYRLSPALTDDAAKAGVGVMALATAADDVVDGEGRVVSFGGAQALGEYLKKVSDMCASFTDAYASAAKMPKDAGLTTAQAYRMAVRSNMLGGAATTAGGAKARVSAAGFIRQKAVAETRALELARLPYEITPETARHVGAALRRIQLASGGTVAATRRRVVADLRMRNVPEDVVRAIEDAYNDADLKADVYKWYDATHQEGKHGDEEADDESGRSDEGFAEERNIAGLVDNDDTTALSRLLRWYFPAEGGSVSATLWRVRDSLLSSGMLSEENVKRLGDRFLKGWPEEAERVAGSVKAFVEALSVGSDATKFDERNAASPLWGSDHDAASRILDDVTGVLARMGKTEYAVAVAAMRNIPTKDGRRTKFLQMLAQMSVADPVYLDRDAETYDFSTEDLGVLVQSDRTPSVIQDLYTSLLAVDTRRVVNGEKRRIAFSGGVESVADGILEMLSALECDWKNVATSPTKWAQVNGDVRANFVDRAKSDVPYEKGPGGTMTYWYYVDKADYDVLKATLAAGKPSERQLAAASAALDRVQGLLRQRMANAAAAADKIFGTGSTYSAMLRSPDVAAYVRRQAERCLRMDCSEEAARRTLLRNGEPSKEEVEREVNRRRVLRKAGVTNLYAMCNYFVSAKEQNRHNSMLDVRYCTMFLAEAVQEPLVNLVRRLVPQTADANRFFNTTHGGFMLDKDRQELRQLLVDALKKATGDAKDVVPYVRAQLNDIALAKASTGRDLSAAATPGGADAGYDASRVLGDTCLSTLVDAYISSLPQSSRTLAGHSANRTEAAKNRSVMTLPSELPASIRMKNHPLFNVSAGGKTLRAVLEENGNRWADGSRCIVSVVGAKDVDGTLVPKDALAGVLDETVRREFVQGASHVILPFFRADKPSCYAIRMPRAVATEWVRAVAADQKLTEALRPDLAALVASVAADLEKADNGEEAGPGLGDRLYRAIFGLAMTAAGQAEIDPKRVATTLAVGAYVPMYRPASETDSDAACYFVSAVGGTTGASLTGGYMIAGRCSENVRSMSEGNPQAQKLHLVSHTHGVNFKKGQAVDRGLGFDEADDGTYRSNLSAVRWYQAQGRREVERVLGLPEGSLDPVRPPENADAAKTDEWTRTVKAAHDEAVAKAKDFLGRSTVVLDDLETNKAGVFGSSFGFAWDGKEDFVLTLPATDSSPGATVVYDVKTKTARDGAGNPLYGGWNVQPDAKNGQMPLMWGLAALCMAKKDGKLSNADVGRITARWRMMNGEISEPMTLKDTGVLAQGDELHVRSDGHGTPLVTFKTRNVSAQIVANNANASTPEYDHTFATNATRDFEILEEIDNARRGTPGATHSFVDAHAGYTMLQLAVLRRNPKLVADACATDPDLVRAYSEHPYDPEVRDKVADKVCAFLRRQALIGYYGTHGVMCPAAANGHTMAEDSRGDHAVRLEWLPGTTQHDKDMFRPARVFGSREEKFYGSSRSWGSGVVNTRNRGFRYGLFLDEALFADLCSELGVAVDPLTDAGTVNEWADVEGCPVSEAATAVMLSKVVRMAVQDDAVRVRLLGCFTDYTGEIAVTKKGGSANARFDDLILPDGRFDYAAVGIGRSRRTSPADPESETGSIYLGGSLFCAHRSPSGNVEAFLGVARATEPYEFRKSDGRVSGEAQYALDPVTMFLQGSDTDGDSAGLQFYDYEAADATEGEQSAVVSQKDIGDFVSHMVEGGDAYEFARLHGWLETTPEGHEVVRESVLRQFMRAAFVAQTEGYRNAATVHQGQVGDRMRAVVEASGHDIVDGSIYVDWLAENAPEMLPARTLDNYFVADVGWTGRQPVGTDAVWDEKVDPADLDGLNARARKVLASCGDVSSLTYDKLLKKFVDAAKYGDKAIDLLDPEKNARLSDAAADSARTRGISVFNQSRLLRAFLRGMAKDVDIPLLQQDSYSPLVDLTSHIDGVSNNLFDTLKMMFATRAGWNQQTLPFLYGTIVRHAAENLEKDPKFRLGNAFFFTEFANFLATLAGGRKGDTSLGRLVLFMDPVHGRQNVRDFASRVGVAFKAWPRATAEEIAEVWCLKNGATIRDKRGRPQLPRGRRALVVMACRAFEYAGHTPQAPMKSALEYENGLLAVQDVMDSVRSFGGVVDYMVDAGKPVSEQARLARQVTDKEPKLATDHVPLVQSRVVQGFAAAAKDFTDSADMIESVCREYDDATRPDRDTNREKYEAWWKNRRDNPPATGSVLVENQQRLAHLVGARVFAEKALGGKWRDLYSQFYEEGRGNRTVQFVAHFADAVRAISNSAWKNYAGPDSVTAKNPRIAEFFRMLDARDGRVDFRMRLTHAQALRMQACFDAVLNSDAVVEDLKYPVAGGFREVKGLTWSQVGRLLMVHAAATRPFGAAADYVGKSNLAAAFGQSRLADFEAIHAYVSRTCLGALDSLLAIGAPVQYNPYVEAVRRAPVRAGRGSAYDFLADDAVRLNTAFAAVEDDEVEDSWDWEGEDVVTRAVRLASDVPSLGRSDDIGSWIASGADRAEHVRAEDLRGRRLVTVEVTEDEGPGGLLVDPAFGTEMRTRTKVVERTGEPARGLFRPTPRSDDSYDTPEEAYNALLAQTEESIVRGDGAGLLSADSEEAQYYRDYYEANGGKAVADSSGRPERKLADILRDAAARSPLVYQVLKSAGSRYVEHRSLAMQRALNMAADAVADGSVPEPEAPAAGTAKARMASEAGGETQEDAEAVRLDFLERVKNTGFRGASAEQLRKTIPDAIKAGFKKAFGRGVTVTQVVRDGEPTNLLKVVRTVDGGKRIITYVSYGDVLGLSNVSRDDQVASVLDMLNGERAKAGREPLTRKDLERLSGHDLDALLHHFQVAGAQAGESSADASLGFAGAMSGLIRLSTDAGFDTLFHEYFHQMLGVYRRLGVYGANEEEQLRKAFSDERGGFDEERAADAYARYVTGCANGWDELRLRDYSKTDEATAKVFARFREVATGIAEALSRGPAETGLPVFVLATIHFGQLTRAQIDKLAAPGKEDVRKVEDMILGQRGQFSTTGMDAAQVAEVQRTLAETIKALVEADPKSEASVKAAQEKAKESGERLKDVEDEPVDPAPESVGADPAQDAEYATVAGKTSQFLRAALTRFRRDGRDGETRRYVAEYLASNVDGSADATSVVYAARRLLREVAAFEGYTLEDEKGNLTKLGRRLLSDQNVAELALRLIRNTEEERGADAGRTDPGKYRIARHAGADYTFARAMEHVTPSAYWRFCRRQAVQSRNSFLEAAARMERAAEAQRATDPAKAAEYDLQAEELRGCALRVVDLAMHVANGDDLHMYAPMNENSGNLHGFLFWKFTGGANFGEKRAFSDGIGRYDAEKGSEYHFDLSDPTVTAAFDYAAMAFFVAEAARKFRRLADQNGRDATFADGVGDHAEPSEGEVATGSEEIEAGGEAARRAEVSGAENPAEITPDELAYEPETTPEWILSNPGVWLDSDLQGDPLGADVRGMLTDHSRKAACEEAYAFVNTMNQALGLDTWVGDGVRAMERRASGLGRNGQGDFAMTGGTRASTVFSNTRGLALGMFAFGERRVGEKTTQGDLRMANWTGQLIRRLAARERRIITGVEVRYLASVDDLERLDGNWRETMSPAAVIRRHVATEEQKREVPETALDVVLYRLLMAVPEDVLGATAGTEVLDGGTAGGLYHDFVAALADGKRDCRDANLANAKLGKPSESPQSFMMDVLRKRGLVLTGGDGRSMVTVANRRSLKAWERSEMRRKLKAAGRPDYMLNPYYWANLCAKQFNAVNRAAAKSRYLTSGAGTAVTLAGTSSYWFYGGTGAHALDVSKYQNALDAMGDARASADDVLRSKEGELFDIIGNVDPGVLGTTAFEPDGSSVVGDRALRYLAFMIGLCGRNDSDFDVRQFVRDICAGKYENADRGVSLGGGMSALDVYMAINRTVCQSAVEGLASGEDLGPAARQDLVDRLAVAERLAHVLSETTPGTVIARSEEQEFRETGRIGDAATAGETLVRMCKELVTAERFRGGLAQMLLTVGSDGSPNYLVDPTDAAPELAGMPDEYWGSLARHYVRTLRRFASSDKEFGMIAYDEGLSGLENARRMYGHVRDHLVASKEYHQMDVDHMRAGRLFRGILCRSTGVDSAGNSCILADMQKGEADCYMRQLFALLRSPSIDSKLQRLDRIMNWTKIASVGFSAFFNVATVFESGVAAAGFWHTVMGMTKTGSGLARAIGRAAGRKGGTGAFTSDAVFMKDLAAYLNSDDPFVRQARELCDLIGMPLDPTFRFQNDRDNSNPVLGSGGMVKEDITKLIRWASSAGWRPSSVRRLRHALQFMYEHPTDYTFNVVLNAVKMSVVMQTMRRLREECLRGGHRFDAIRELRRHSSYINAEIGGIDPARYAWATPELRKILSLGMFSWQWTAGAWIAGGGEAVTDALFGGHSSTPAQRQRSFVRWLRMLGIVKVGVPVVLQAAVKALAKALSAGLPPDDEIAEDVERMPWLCPLNESRVGSLCFDVTPLLKLAARVPGVAWTKENVPVIGPLVPGYVGGGRNTTGGRRYYMHFGKQSDEFFRWFEDPLTQAFAKTSVPVQKLYEFVKGVSISGGGAPKAFAEKGMIGRVFNMSTDPEENAFFNALSAMTPFSWQSASTTPDAGIVAAIGPLKMGESKRSTRLRIAERLKDLVEDDRTNNPWSYPGNRRKLNLLCTDILREARLNGIPPDKVMSSALGDVAKVQYAKLMDALPKDIRTNRVDGEKLVAAVRALVRINKKYADIKSSILQKYEASGRDLKTSPAMRRIVLDLIRAAKGDPLRFTGGDAEDLARRYKEAMERERRSTQMDDKGGENFGNFLATDDVPPTLFGVPVVTDRYTEEDLEFFKGHPEAGGFYEMGDEEPGPEPPDRGPGGRAADKGGDAGRPREKLNVSQYRNAQDRAVAEVLNKAIDDGRTATGRETHAASFVAYADTPGAKMTEGELKAEARRRWRTAQEKRGDDSTLRNDYTTGKVTHVATLADGTDTGVYDPGARQAVAGTAPREEFVGHPTNNETTDRRTAFARTFGEVGEKVTNKDANGNSIGSLANYVASAGDERNAAMSSIFPYAAGRTGNTMQTAEDLARFWRDMKSKARGFVDADPEHGADNFTSMLNLPWNGQGLVRAYLEADARVNPADGSQPDAEAPEYKEAKELLDWLLSPEEMNKLTMSTKAEQKNTEVA